MTEYLPEGCLIGTADNRSSLLSYYTLSECMTSGKILEAPCIICDSHHNLILDLGCMKGFIPREEGALGITEGTTKDIALISRVNKPVAFVITDFRENENGETYAVLSRRLAQERCMRDYLGSLTSGDIIPARVTHLEPFGCFVDVGCGIPSLIPIDMISVSRITHPKDRFSVGQNIHVVVKSVDNGRICLSHKKCHFYRSAVGAYRHDRRGSRKTRLFASSVPVAGCRHTACPYLAADRRYDESHCQCTYGTHNRLYLVLHRRTRSH